MLRTTEVAFDRVTDLYATLGIRWHTRLGFDNSYARLPARFYARQSPAAVAEPGLVQLNQAQKYRYDRDRLVQMLGEIMAENP